MQHCYFQPFEKAGRLLLPATCLLEAADALDTDVRPGACSCTVARFQWDTRLTRSRFSSCLVGGNKVSGKIPYLAVRCLSTSR
jgi:hypothetical protein